MRQEGNARRLPFSDSYSDVVTSPPPPWGGGEGTEARRGEGQAVKMDEVWAWA